MPKHKGLPLLTHFMPCGVFGDASCLRTTCVLCAAHWLSALWSITNKRRLSRQLAMQVFTHRHKAAELLHGVRLRTAAAEHRHL